MPRETTKTKRSFQVHFLSVLLLLSLCLNLILLAQMKDSAESLLEAAEETLNLPRFKSGVRKALHDTGADTWLSNLPFLGDPVLDRNIDASGNTSNYIVDELCHGCRSQEHVTPRRKGKRDLLTPCMQILMAQPGKNLTEKGRAFKRLHPEITDCGRCDPDSCGPERKIYFRPDRMVVPHDPVSYHSGVSHILKSVPRTHRLPVDALADLAGFVDRPENVYPAKRFLFEFNPSIVVLPSDQKPVDKAVYLATYRVGEQHNCLTDETINLKSIGSYDRKDHLNFLAFATLDDNLNILQETIIDVKQFTLRKFQDPRAFALNGQLYITSFGDMYRFWLVPTTSMSKRAEVLEHAFPHVTGYQRLRVHMAPWSRRKRQLEYICISDPGLYVKAKNLNYFTQGEDVYAELYPMGNMERMSLERCQPDGNWEPLERNFSKIRPSYATTIDLAKDNMLFWQTILTSERGSACCARIHHNGQNLLLGVSHSKTPFRYKKHAIHQQGLMNVNQFLSAFYAFEDAPPFRVVARSGHFCFPRDPSDQGNPYTHVPSNKFFVGGHFDCPSIHFVSGLSLDAQDPSKLIVAFGDSDCTPRFVTIPVNHVIDMLFDPLKLKQ